MPDTSHAPARLGPRAVIITLDNHLRGTVDRAARQLQDGDTPITLSLHAAVDWDKNPDRLEAARSDIARADILIVTMLFLDDHIKAVLPALEARAKHCDAVVGALAAGEVIKLTRIGRLDMSRETKGPLALLKRLRGSKKSKTSGSSGAGQMAMLRRLPKLLRFIPGTAQDLRAYFLTMQYWLGGSDVNVANMVRLLATRYAGERYANLRASLSVAPPVDYPDVGLYHPRLKSRMTETLTDLDTLSPKNCRGTVGLLLMRSYVLSGDTAHYDAVIDALEARGLRVIPAFAAALDGRPAMERFFRNAENSTGTIDALVSLTGFSLVGGPAYNDSDGAVEALSSLDVPYIAAHGLEFQSLDDWRSDGRGLSPIETTMMIAIPELDGATVPTVFGGRDRGGAMAAARRRIKRLADRVEKLIDLRSTPLADRRIAVTLFNFPPGGGAAGTAAHLSVFRSLHNLLTRLKSEGYSVGDLPADSDALHTSLMSGDPERPADMRVHHRISRDDHIAREPWLEDIESVWGPAPGLADTDGRDILVHGKCFGNVLVTLQPSMGTEGDPMRLLFDKGFAPTHAMSAYYRYLRDDFGAHVQLHFGTHGTLEFMPGKQAGLSDDCWPERLIGETPHVYLYAANNPSEGTIAKRRSAATLVSYLTPPLQDAGLYQGLADLDASINSWRQMAPDEAQESKRRSLIEVIQAQATALDLVAADDGPWSDSDAPTRIEALRTTLREVHDSLIPDGLHTLGDVLTPDGLRGTLKATIKVLTAGDPAPLSDSEMEDLALRLIANKPLNASETQRESLRSTETSLRRMTKELQRNPELDSLVHALGGGYTPPAPGGDLIRSPEILPTGRNTHAFDPFRLPTAAAMTTGQKQADLLLAHLTRDSGQAPKSIAVVLWGTDNIKSGGDPIGQVLALLGARPRLDSYGRVCGATLVPLSDLKRPRVDVVLTLSGIFRDLLPVQSRMLAEAVWLAASAEDEPAEMNPVRTNTLSHMASTGADFETAALRVFTNADGAYGSNVNMMVDAGCWDSDDELVNCYGERKSFAINRSGDVMKERATLDAALMTVDATYQNLDSVELGVTTIDHYFDTLGGISKAITQAKGGSDVPVLIGDQTVGTGHVRTLGEQVALETRTRALNPRWYDGMLAHGFEGVRQIEATVTNTLGWSATTGQVAPWVYQKLTETYVLDEEMRNRLAALNPGASFKLVNRLKEACERAYWEPDAETLASLEAATDALEDQLEGLLPATNKEGAAA